MMKLCVVEGADGNLYARENEQRLLRNMDVHVVVLDLLRIPYDKVSEDGIRERGSMCVCNDRLSRRKILE